MTDDISDEVQEKIAKLQMIERNLQNFSMQKQMLQAQLAEVESAIDELKTTKKSYRIVGNIMVLRDKDELAEELDDRKVTLTKRVDTLGNQENKMRENAQSLQEELMKNIK